MKSIYNILVAFVLVSTFSLVSSCKKDDNTPKGNGPVTLHFDNRFGADDLVLGTTYTNQAGEQLAISTFNYYVSNIVLVKEDGGEYVVPKDECYHLVREGVDSTYELELENVPAGNYNTLKFIIFLTNSVFSSVYPVLLVGCFFTEFILSLSYRLRMF